MKDDIKNNIIGFSIYNQYTVGDTILGIASGLCKKYGWSTEDIKSGSIGKRKAFEYTIKAATECKDVYAIATVLFLKEYSSEIENVGYCITNEALLIEMIEILESIEDKDEFVCFLLGRANFSGRGAELDFEKVLYYFDRAAKGGIEIARLFYHEIKGEFDAIFNLAERLARQYPDSHIIKFYLAHCCYHGYGTEKNYEKVVELVGYTAETETCNNDPIDYYFLASRYLLGLCYFHGYAVEKDLRRAQELFHCSGASYNPEAWYTEAITMLLSDKDKDPTYIWHLLEKSALRGCLPAARKVMLCLRVGYGVEPDKELYTQYADYYDHEKETGETVSDLGYEADHCDLIDCKKKVIKDDEID